MKDVIFLCCVVAVGFAHGGIVPTTTLLRTPSLDSAIIKSERLGGNFAYSTVEGHAYTAVSPIVQRIAEPVISYTAQQIPIRYATAPLFQSYYNTPIIAAPSYIATQPWITPITSGVIAQTPAAVVPSSPEVSAPQQPLSNAPANIAPGATVDDDTVSVESA